MLTSLQVEVQKNLGTDTASWTMEEIGALSAL